MLRNAVAVCMLWIVAIAHAQGPADDFRGLKWGSKPAKGMKLDRTFAGMQQYTLTGDDPVVLGKAARSILYSYFRGGLCSVDVRWPLIILTDVDELFVSAKQFWGETNVKEGERFKDALWLSASEATLGNVVAFKIVGDKWDVYLSMRNVKCSKEASERSGL